MNSDRSQLVEFGNQDRCWNDSGNRAEKAQELWSGPRDAINGLDCMKVAIEFHAD